MKLIWKKILVLFVLVALVRNEDNLPCPPSCVCSSIDPLSEGFCRGCPTGSSISMALKVKCEGIGLSDIPSDVPSDVNWLDVSKNNLTLLQSDSVSQLSKLIHLKVSQNNILTIQDGTFKGMDTIQILDLDLNNLTILEKSSFTGAETLVHLDLSGNRLENVDHVFGGLKELSRLDLRNNRLTQLTPHTFRGLSSLRYLLLTSNRIHYVDRRAFRPLEKLVYIVLKGNPIGDQTTRFHFHSNFLTYVDVSECGFAQVPKGLPGSARYLQLRRNNLTNLMKMSFIECPYVTILVLDENRIDSIEDRTFEHMTQLQQLWLNNNRLIRIPRPLPSSIERLLMDLNGVYEIEVDSFPPSSHINTLSLMGNNITQIVPGSFDSLEKLKTMDLSNNRIRRLNSRTFARLAQLKVLQLSSNPIQSLDAACFYGLSSVATLSLAYVPTEFPTINEAVFDDLTQVSRLDLDSSPGLINSVLTSRRFLTSLGRLQELSVRSSDLVQLRFNVFQFLPNLTTVRLSSTRWNCDRSIIWLRDWMLSTTIRLDDSEENRCSTPRSLHGRSLLSLDTDEFSAISDDVNQPVTLHRHDDVTSPPVAVNQSSEVIQLSDDVQDSSSTLSSSKPLQSKSEEDQLGSEGFDIDAIYDQTSRLLPPPPPPPPVISSTDPADENDTDDFRFNNEEYQGQYTFSDTSRRQQETLLKTLKPKTTTSTESGNRSGVSYSRSTLAIVIATVAATLIIAVVILGVIIYLTKDKRNRRTRSKADVTTKTIPYKHKNGILYYTPSGAKSEVDPPDLIRKTTSSEIMTLIPGRDFNHEGPIRVYKWEDF